MHEARATRGTIRAGVAGLVFGTSLVIGLVAPNAVAAAPTVAPAADVTTLVVVPPEPAPAPAVVTPAPTATLIPADVVHAPATPTPAPAPAVAPAPARVAGSQVEAPAPQHSESDSTTVADAHAASNERSYRTSSLRIEIAATDAAHRTATIRSSSGGVIAGPFNVDGAPIQLDGLDAGDIDLILEDATENAGSTMSRTPISLQAGNRHVARCDTVTLDCTVS